LNAALLVPDWNVWIFGGANCFIAGIPTVLIGGFPTYWDFST
jgi:hypothetical protein